MHYRLRTLLIVLALGPMVLAGAWFVPEAAYVVWSSYRPRVYHTPQNYGLHKHLRGSQQAD